MKSVLPAFLLLCLATATNAQNPNHTLRGKVLYQSSGNKPAVGVRVAEPDATAVFSVDNGDYQLIFQNKRNGAALALEVGKDDGKSQKLELVNEKEVKAAKLPASTEEILEIIVCPAGQRDIAAQKYYRILRTAADRELEKKKKEVETLLAQKEKDYQKVSDLFAQLDRMQAALDSAKIREQAFNIASINLDRASQMVKDAVRKIEERNDVEGALRVLSAEALDTAYQIATGMKKQAEAAIQQVIEGYEFKISLLEPKFKYEEIAGCYDKLFFICQQQNFDVIVQTEYLNNSGVYWGKNGDYQKELEIYTRALNLLQLYFPKGHKYLKTLFSNIASVQGNLGHYEKEMEFSNKALNSLMSENNFDSLELADISISLCVAYNHLGKHQEGLNLSMTILNIRKNRLPNLDPDIAKSYKTIAYSFFKLGDYQNALLYNQKGIDILKKILPEGHPDLATAYNNISKDYYYLGDIRQSFELQKKALSIYEAILPPYHPELARFYNNISVNYLSVGDYEAALAASKKSINIREQILPADHPDLATSYNNIAYIYGDMGNYPKQLEFNLLSMIIREKTLPPRHGDLLVSYNNVGWAYREVGELEKAIEYGQKAIEYGEASNPKHRFLNRFYFSLGVSYVKAKKYPEAKAALEKSESLKAEERVYRGWAMYYCLQNDKIKAYENLKKAVNLGFKDAIWIEKEESLECIRDWAAYKNLVEQLKKQ